MNNDLISRKYVIRELLKEREHYPPMVAERYSFGVKLPHHFNQAMRGGIRKCLRIVETAPTVDVEPVRQGRWSGNSLDFSCSACGVYQNIYTGRTNYCPNCGAKMRGVESASE